MVWVHLCTYCGVMPEWEWWQMTLLREAEVTPVDARLTSSRGAAPGSTNQRPIHNRA